MALVACSSSILRFALSTLRLKIFNYLFTFHIFCWFFRHWGHLWGYLKNAFFFFCFFSFCFHNIISIFGLLFPRLSHSHEPYQQTYIFTFLGKCLFWIASTFFHRHWVALINLPFLWQLQEGKWSTMNKVWNLRFCALHERKFNTHRHTHTGTHIHTLCFSESCGS